MGKLKEFLNDIEKECRAYSKSSIDFHSGKAEMASIINNLLENQLKGYVVELPCKVGDIVYKICPVSKFIEFGEMRNGIIVTSNCHRCPYGSCDCHSIGFQKDARNVIVEVKAENEIWILKRKNYFGKIYFLTESDADNELRKIVDELN